MAQLNLQLNSKIRRVKGVKVEGTMANLSKIAF